MSDHMDDLLFRLQSKASVGFVEAVLKISVPYVTISVVHFFVLSPTNEVSFKEHFLNRCCKSICKRDIKHFSTINIIG